MQSTSFAGRIFTASCGLGDENNVVDRVLAAKSGATPNLTDQLLDLLPAAVYVCASDGTILRFNRRAAELWGPRAAAWRSERPLLRCLSPVPTGGRFASAR